MGIETIANYNSFVCIFSVNEYHKKLNVILKRCASNDKSFATECVLEGLFQDRFIFR